jgi:transposase
MIWFLRTCLAKNVRQRQVLFLRGQAMGYPSDLTDAEWALIEQHFQPRDRRSSASLHPRKRIVDAVLYVMKSGCQWRTLPNDFTPLANGLRSLQPMEQTRCGKPRWSN